MDKLRTDVGINPSINAVGVATSLYTREADYTQYGSPCFFMGWCRFLRVWVKNNRRAGACSRRIPLPGTRRLK